MGYGGGIISLNAIFNKEILPHPAVSHTGCAIPWVGHQWAAIKMAKSQPPWAPSQSKVALAFILSRSLNRQNDSLQDSGCHAHTFGTCACCVCLQPTDLNASVHLSSL
jgi:hypothetical protein